MWSTLKELVMGKDLDSDEVSYEIKKFTRKKLNKAFKAYIEKIGRNNSSFKRTKVSLMKDWGIDEYTSYHITELFSENKIEFPKRGKNIPEDLLIKILGNMNIDTNWFFTESLNSPVRFLNENISNNNNKKLSEINIPIYNDLKQLTEPDPQTISLTNSILRFLGLSYINSNEKHPIFQYYNFVFAKVNNSYYLTNLWNQDLEEGIKYLTYGKSDMKFQILEHSKLLDKVSEVFILGQVLTVLEKLVETT